VARRYDDPSPSYLESVMPAIDRAPVSALNYPSLISHAVSALVVIDPQNDVLSEKGVSWGLVGDSVRENNTVENLDRLFKAAKDRDFGVFISPHYLYPHDQAWQFGGAVEKMMLEDKEFFRPDALGLDGFSGSGADWLDRYKTFIEDGKTVVVSPHKVWGPQTNDLVLQLRKRRVEKIILAGMLANLCVESHLRELLEQGFEVAVVKDATAAPRHPEIGDGYKAAVINFGFIANAVVTTDEAATAMR
jgi:nicotinamidase-related amidase